MSFVNWKLLLQGFVYVARYDMDISSLLEIYNARWQAQFIIQITGNSPSSHVLRETLISGPGYISPFAMKHIVLSWFKTKIVPEIKIQLQHLTSISAVFQSICPVNMSRWTLFDRSKAKHSYSENHSSMRFYFDKKGKQIIFIYIF